MVYEDYSELLDLHAFGSVLESREEEYLGRQEIDQLLTEAHKEERRRVESFLEEIEEQLQERTALHENLVHELELELERYEENLQKLLSQFGSGSRERKKHQKTRIRELSGEIRKERRRHWLDRQELLAERRELRRELDVLDDDPLLGLL